MKRGTIKQEILLLNARNDLKKYHLFYIGMIEISYFSVL